MKIKSIFTILLAFVAITATVPAWASNVNPGDKEVPKEVRKAQIESRILEIKEYAATHNLTSVEKKELRKEVRAMKKEARDKGIYLSIGAIIIILLLLILIVD